MRRLFSVLNDEKAATAVEYGLILALVFLAMIAGIQNFTDTTIGMWNHVSNSVQAS